MYTYIPQGVCSQEINVTLDRENRIEKVEVIGGCDGNALGLSAMCADQDARSVIKKLRGIQCGEKPTSCPDQLSLAIEKALTERGIEL
ncbi:MAG: TIGR03905 family TSCPD domain-containing protein [Synergistaceae bacterium]|jgi:uncharacterized protein (TIGR03905 family)|nr:TIGR03905 family TSCPD domain-containing protein [Synergistaceae bacterium]